MNADSGSQIQRIRLLTLGALDLEAHDGTKVQSVLQQPKRLAVLLYLALARPHGYQRRDRLVALFWPEQDQEKARKALNTAVHFLRRSLSKDAIDSRGDEELGIGEAYVWCDAVACEKSLEEGRLEEGLALYQGELLSGFYVPEAPAFEQWLEDERRRLRDRAYKAALALTDSADKTGSLAAADWARRALEIAPHEEAALRRLIQILVAHGDRAGAVRAYDDFARRLMLDYELEPSADTQRLIEAARVSEERPPSGESTSPATALAGPAFSRAPVRAPDISPENRAVTESFEPAADDSVAPARGRRWNVPAMAAGVALSVAMLVTFWTTMSTDAKQPDAPPGPLNSVAIMYFDDNTRDQKLGYLANTITNTLITELSSVRQLSVISKNGVSPFRGSSLPIDSIARILRVGTMVGGSMERSGDSLRIRVEMIDAATAKTVYADVVQRRFGDDFALIDGVVSEVAAFLRVRLGEEIKLRKWQAGTESVNAWKLVQQADELRDRAEEARMRRSPAASEAALRSAEQMLAQAAQIAPRWTEPLILQSRIAEDRAFMALRTNPPTASAWFDQALSIAKKAVALDEDDPAALEQMALILFFRAEIAPADPNSSARDQIAAQDALEKVVQIDDTRARSWSYLSTILNARGRYQAGKEAAERAYNADAYLHESHGILMQLYSASFELGQDAEARTWCATIGRRFPSSDGYLSCELELMAWSDEMKPDPAKAWGTVNNSRKDPPQIQTAMLPRLMQVAAVLARAGQVDSARAVIHKAALLSPDYPDRGFFQAVALTAVGDYREAIRLLTEWVTMNPGPRRTVLGSRRLKALRGYPEFDALLVETDGVVR